MVALCILHYTMQHVRKFPSVCGAAGINDERRASVASKRGSNKRISQSFFIKLVLRRPLGTSTWMRHASYRATSDEQREGMPASDYNEELANVWEFSTVFILSLIETQIKHT